MTSRICDVSYDTWPEKELAFLTDKNQHTWRVCPTCVDVLWKTQRPLLDPPSGDAAHHEMAVMELAKLVGSVAVFRDLLSGIKGVPASLVSAMDVALTDARKVYSSDD